MLGCIWLARRTRIVLVTKLSHAAFFGESIPAGVNTGVAMLLVQGAQGAVLFFIYLWTVFLLNQFSATASWSEELRLFLVNLFVEFGGGALRALPGLFAVVIVILIARWSVRLVNALFNEVESGRLTFSWVERETARTTQTIVVVAIWLFALVVAYPYIPGSNTEAFKGLSVLVGLMITLGSTGLINEFGVPIMAPHFESQPEKRIVVPKTEWHAAPATPSPVSGEINRESMTGSDSRLQGE